jgi:hypothetical protein
VNLERCPPSDANNLSAGEEILHLLWNPKSHYHGHKNLQLRLILSQTSLFHTLTPNFFIWNLKLSFHLYLDFLSFLFPSNNSVQLD